MKFKLHAEIRLDPSVDLNHLKQVIEPENVTPDHTDITTSIDDEQLITRIHGRMSIGTLLRSIDDILATASLAESVADTTIRTDNKRDQPQ